MLKARDDSAAGFELPDKYAVEPSPSTADGNQFNPLWHDSYVTNEYLEWQLGLPIDVDPVITSGRLFDNTKRPANLDTTLEEQAFERYVEKLCAMSAAELRNIALNGEVNLTAILIGAISRRRKHFLEITSARDNLNTRQNSI